MAATITLFPVGNGDMALIQTEGGFTILIDVNIRLSACDPDDDAPDVLRMLRERLQRDARGRLCVDAFLLGHPDQDHCRGLREHFHLGPPGEWSARMDKILIREVWSSPMVFRRALRRSPLCEDARAFNAEARRRVQRFRDARGAVGDGDRVLILGEDEGGKTDDLGAILVRVGGVFSRINGQDDPSMVSRLLGPAPRGGEDEEEMRSKNGSSTILNIALAGGGVADKARLFTCGDVGVAILERLWRAHGRSRRDWLSYDLLLSPHHCSWRSLSYDSWSEKGEAAEVCEEARSALAQARPGGTVVASSKPVRDDDADPPCIRAKREYQSIVSAVKGTFRCTMEHPSEDAPDAMEFVVDRSGLRPKAKLMSPAAVTGAGAVGRQPLPHG